MKKSYSITCVRFCDHISCETPGRIWISDTNSLFLLDSKTGMNLYNITNSCKLKSGFHTMNSKFELIYICKNFKINKLSRDRKTQSTFIESQDPEWKALSVYYSTFTGDLLVGIKGISTDTGMVRRYDPTGGNTQTIPDDKTPHTLYRNPLFITENCNGDVVVSELNKKLLLWRHAKEFIVFPIPGLHQDQNFGHLESVLTRFHTYWCVMVTPKKFICWTGMVSFFRTF